MSSTKPKRRKNKLHLLVTGAASFIGANFIPMALNKGWTVTATMRNLSKYFEDLGIANLPAHIVEMDICDADSYQRLPKKVDAIVHLAAIRTGENSVEKMISSNVIGSQLISYYAKQAGARSIIYASTMSVYGDIKVPTVSETTDIINPDPYGLTKYLGEQIFLDKSNGANYRTLAIRLPSVLGKNAPDHWLSQILSKVKVGEEITVYNPNANFNNTVDIKTLGAFMLNVLERDWIGFHALPIGADNSMTIHEIVEFFKDNISQKSKIISVPSDQISFQISNNLAVTNFGYQPRKIEPSLLDFIEANGN